MPLHFPGLGHKDKSPPPTPPPAPQHRDSAQSTTSATSSSALSSSNPPSSILKRSGDSSTTAATSTSASASGSSGISQRLAKGLTIARTETASTATTTTTDADVTSPSGSTAPTSLSDLSSSDNCPLPQSAPGHRFPFFTMTLSSTGTLSFIAMPVIMRPAVLESINRAWKKGAGISKITEIDYTSQAIKAAREAGRVACDGGVWEVSMKDTPWLPNSQDKVSSRRILINLLTTFAAEGYNLVSSYRTSAKDSSKDTLSFLQGEPDPEPIFMAVAFHSSDKIWIIDAEADVGEAVEEGIRKFWDAGIRDARVRERHCREIRLKGNPWTSHKTNSLISSRIIHLAILKHITHMDRGYDFVGSVDMSDAEEGEMPVTFYRRRWGSQRAVWTMDN